MNTITLLVVILLAWSGVCVLAGRIYEERRQRRELAQDEADEMNARDEWANQREQGAA